MTKDKARLNESPSVLSGLTSCGIYPTPCVEEKFIIAGVKVWGQWEPRPNIVRSCGGSASVAPTLYVVVGVVRVSPPHGMQYYFCRHVLKA